MYVNLLEKLIANHLLVNLNSTFDVKFYFFIPERV